MYTISDDTADEDLNKFWESIIARLNEKTKWNLNAKSTATIDQVILKINAPKDADPEKHAQSKKVWRSTMKCVDRLGIFVQRFGAFAAQAASVVFGPANQCFNAINFVITAAQQYKDIFANITTLMERISVFLENLDGFMTNNDAEVKLDKRLRKTVYRVLEHFLRIMSTTYDLTNSWTARAKLKGKSFAFGEDDGIKGYLATMETLVSDFTGAQISVIVQDLSAAARDIRGVDKKLDVLGEASEKQTAVLEQLATADASRTAQEREKKDREVVKKALGIDESKSPWDRQTDIWESHITGTGQWLKDRPSFARWADSKATAADVITLKAPSGFGKSHLASIVIRHLQDKHRGDARVVVAYYYLQRESSEKSSVINRIMKTIIWQLARANREYLKAAAIVCDPSQGLDSSRNGHLWRKLVTDLAKSVEMTVFVVLDGIDEIDTENDRPDLIEIMQQVRHISDDKASHLKVRAFITGTKEALDSINESTELAVPEIQLEPNPQTEEPSLNQADLELFVTDRLERAERVKRLDLELKGRITRELAKGARGAYSRLLYLLDDIVNIQNTNQIEEILERANQSLRDIIESKVAALNSSLSRDEISEVNTLLSWLTMAYEDLSVVQCEAILSLKADGQSLGLEDRIRRKYSDMFSLDDTKQITLRAGVEDYLRESNETSTNQIEALQRSQIQPSEVNLIQKVLVAHFRNVFGDEDVYTRFAFDSFFANKLGDQALRIRLIPTESAIKVAQGCLVAVCEKYNDDRSSDLLGYSYNWFIEHLLVDLDVVDLAIKQDIGRKLTRMLREPALIEAWWAPDQMYLTSFFVFSRGIDYNLDLVGHIHKWLKDPGVQKGLTDMPSERDWVASVTAGDTPDFTVYSNVARMMARRWFDSQDEGEWGPAVAWLAGYLGSTQGQALEYEDPISLSLLREVESWAKEQLGNADQAGRWHGLLAATFRRGDYNNAAIAEYRFAIELRPTEWALKMGLAEVLAANDNYADAVKTMEDLIEQNQHLLEAEDEEFTTVYWDRLLHDLGDWNIHREEFAVAESTYRKILDRGLQQQDLAEPTHKAIVSMLVVLNKQGRSSDAIALLDLLIDRKDSDGDDWLTLLFREYYNDKTFHNQLAMAARRSGVLEPVSQKYRNAIGLVPPPDRLALQVIDLALRYYYAALLWNLGTPEQQESALDLWEEVVHHDPIAGFEAHVAWFRTYGTRDLAPALLSRSRTSREQEDRHASYVARLEQLTKLDFGDSAQTSKDPRLTLARLYQLSGDEFKAKEIVRHLIKKAFDEAEADGQSDGYYFVAVVLQSLNDDGNALAAWSHYVPIDPANEATASEEETDDISGDSESDEPADDQDADADTVAGAERDMAGLDISDDTTQTNGVLPSEEAPDKSTYKGSLNNFCDGDCGAKWTYADDIYACKDCLDTQLNEECYKKLKAGELDVGVCRSDHEYLKIPPFDETAWQTLPKDIVMVGGQQVPRSEWIQRMKVEWEIDDQSLKRSADAAQKIQRVWKACKAFRRTATKRSVT